MKLKHTQNFFVDANSAHAIMNIIKKYSLERRLYEIGTGKGFFTEVFAESRLFDQILTVELDEKLYKYSDYMLHRYRNITCIHSSYETIQLNQTYTLFSNMPYGITTDILRYILRNHIKLPSVFLIMQKEAAKRFIGKHQQSIISILINTYYKFKIENHIDRNSFRPVPNVDSVFVSMISKKSCIDFEDYTRFLINFHSRSERIIKRNLQSVFSYNQVKRLMKKHHIYSKDEIGKLSHHVWIDLYVFYLTIRNSEKEEIINQQNRRYQKNIEHYEWRRK